MSRDECQSAVRKPATNSNARRAWRPLRSGGRSNVAGSKTPQSPIHIRLPKNMGCVNHSDQTVLTVFDSQPQVSMLSNESSQRPKLLKWQQVVKSLTNCILPRSFGWGSRLKTNSTTSRSPPWRAYSSIENRLQIIEHLRSNRQRTDPQKIEIQQRRNVLARRIKAWRVAQAVYMPQAVAYLPDEDSSPTSDDTQTSDISKPETWPLLLPSAIPQDDHSLCYKGIIATEVLLRSAQLQDNLMDLRQSRRALRNLQLYFKTNVAGEGIKTQTKTRTIETSTTNRINRAVRRYRTAYGALLELDPSGDWAREFRELRNEDNRGPLKEVGELGVGDGRYAPSWIWTTPSATALPGEGSDAE